MSLWDTSQRKRAQATAKTVEYWYRQHYKIPISDPRYQALTIYEMIDEFNAHLSYMRLAKGQPDEETFETDMTEDQLLDDLDALSGIAPDTDDPDPAWETIADDDLDALLDNL